MQLISYGVVDLILVALLVHDRIERHYAQVYPGMLVVFLVSQVPTFFVPQTAWWLAFTKWFARLPLP